MAAQRLDARRVALAAGPRRANENPAAPSARFFRHALFSHFVLPSLSRPHFEFVALGKSLKVAAFNAFPNASSNGKDSSEGRVAHKSDIVGQPQTPRPGVHGHRRRRRSLLDGLASSSCRCGKAHRRR